MYSGRAACVRQQVNAYIKSGVFDGFFDFDAAVTDAGNRPSLLALYDTWARPTDCISHPVAYQNLADSVDLTLFAK
jgi:hypothetical protein